MRDGSSIFFSPGHLSFSVVTGGKAKWTKILEGFLVWHVFGGTLEITVVGGSHKKTAGGG